MKAKSSWIPRKEFFERLKAGTLPPELASKYKNKKTKFKIKKKVRRLKKTKKVSHNSKNKTLYNFTVYLNGEEVEVIQGRNALKVEREMRAKYNSKSILLGKELA